MGDTKKKAAAPAERKKPVRLTDAQRLEKLEAELAAQRAKVEAKATLEYDEIFKKIKRQEKLLAETEERKAQRVKELDDRMVTINTKLAVLYTLKVRFEQEHPGVAPKPDNVKPINPAAKATGS